ncbi:YegS/Rv2252/BmrU family lipid kinase [Thermonema lapsum]|uniref:YegS/Rv2252/BmrU family lipid kinase n=1 Tax=Thermonema lapsum TaxID=28195 RepID=A0A846MLY6_9BACT|nr:diacylglycerol kinase family protein [Thermonema lapsum]NIK72553.1 YegS/Rv2252/BmrU family lipid kinase [Thermonema lapsum]
MKTQRIVFIINPIAGGKSKDAFCRQIRGFFAEDEWQIEIHSTRMPGDATVLARQAIAQPCRAVVAVGGDGTINEVAQALINTNIPLGVLPFGSGNGLARHFGIPLKAEEALKLLISGKPQAIDVGQVNEKLFLCTTGIGFDAAVSERFASYKARGFMTYVRSTLETFATYRPEEVEIDWGEGRRAYTVFSATVANISQYGNNAYIAPVASADDTYLDLCILKPFPKWQMPLIALALFTKQLPRFAFYEHRRVKKVTFYRKQAAVSHFDGENAYEGKELHIEVRPQALHLIAPQ